MAESSVPIKRMSAKGKDPMVGILREAAEREGQEMTREIAKGTGAFELISPEGTLSRDAVSPFMGAVAGDRANPTIRVSSAQVANPADISAATRVERLERVLGKGAVAKGAATLRSQGNPQPRFDDVMSFLEGEYEAAGGKPMDEAELSRTIGRKEAVARRGQETEDAAMKRLLEGPLKPGPESFRAPEVGPSLAAGPSPVEAEKRRRMGRIPSSAITAAGSGLLAALALNSGGLD